MDRGRHPRGRVCTDPLFGGALGWEIPGIKQVFYGLVLLAVVMFLPHGIWPAVARKLKIRKGPIVEFL